MWVPLKKTTFRHSRSLHLKLTCCTHKEKEMITSRTVAALLILTGCLSIAGCRCLKSQQDSTARQPTVISDGKWS